MTGEVGVLVCSFAGGKEKGIDTKTLAAFARNLPEVAWSSVVDDLCSEPSRPKIVSMLKETGVDRFVVAACSPMIQERRLMSIAAEAGLNPFMFTVANVREQSALVHNGEEAQRKAEVLLSMAAAKCLLLAPAPYDLRIPEDRSVAILGDGVRAALVAQSLEARDIETVIVAPSKPLRLPILMDEAIAERLTTGKKGQMVIGEIVEVDGAPGAFELLVEGEEPGAIRCGAVITAFDPLPATDEIGAKQLEEALESGKVPSSVAIIADS